MIVIYLSKSRRWEINGNSQLLILQQILSTSLQNIMAWIAIIAIYCFPQITGSLISYWGSYAFMMLQKVEIYQASLWALAQFHRFLLSMETNYINISEKIISGGIYAAPAFPRSKQKMWSEALIFWFKEKV